MRRAHSQGQHQNGRYVHKLAAGDLVTHPRRLGEGTVLEVHHWHGHRHPSVTVRWPPQEFVETYGADALTKVRPPKDTRANGRAGGELGVLEAGGRFYITRRGARTRKWFATEVRAWAHVHERMSRSGGG